MAFRSTLPVAALCAALALSVLSGCGSSDPDDGLTADGGVVPDAIRSMAIAKGQRGPVYAAPDVPITPDTLVMATDNAYTTYNNNTADGNNQYNTFALVQVLAGVFKLDGNNKVLLNTDVMESAEVTSAQPQVVTYKLKDVRWSDGEAWDCDDFYLTWLSQSGKVRRKDTGGPQFLAASTAGYELIESVTCPDTRTVVTSYANTYPDWRSLFGVNIDVLPAHILEKQVGVADITRLGPNDTKQLALVADFWNTRWNGFDPTIMPASGPYRITAHEPDNSVTLERNEAWNGRLGGPSTIVIRAMADSVAQAQALENGEIQVISSAQPDGNAADRLRALAGQGVRFGSTAGLGFEHLDLNYRNPILADQTVRRAFMQCVDRDALVEKLIRPVQPDARPLGNLNFFVGEDGYTDNYAQYRGDVGESRATLAEAGWQFGADGYAVKGGVKLRLRISHTDIPRRKQTVELIQSQCRAAGFEIVDDTDPNFLDTRASAGDYDIALFAWSSAPFKSQQKPVYETGGGQNWSAYSNPVVDEALRNAVSQEEMADARKYYQEADATIAEDNYSLPLYMLPNMWAFKGVDRVYHQSYHGAAWNANEWVLDK